MRDPDTVAQITDLVPVADVPVGRCSATNRQGNRCGQAAIPGGFVCRFHGGSAPQVRAAARRRLMALAPKALDTIAKLLDAESESVRYRASADLLDRLGLSAAQEHVLVPAEATNEDLDARILAALEARATGAPGDGLQ